MTESKAPPKEKTALLEDDFDGWKKLTIRAQTVVSKGDPNKPGFLKKDFKVLDAEGSPAPAIANGWITISDKQLLGDRVTLEFSVNVDRYIPLKEVERCDYFLLSVQAQLDLPQAKAALGAALGMATGMGALGATLAGAGIDAALTLEVKVKIKVQVPIARVTLRKFRWSEVKEYDLMENMNRSELAQLYREGGELLVPTKTKPVQVQGQDGGNAPSGETPGRTLYFDSDIRIFDTEGELRWMGNVIKGEHDDGKDPERRYLRFKVPLPGAGGADLAPDSPTRVPGGGDVGIG
jgi:hypothetical protein